MKWNIVADSSCDLLEMENLSSDTNYAVVPFKIQVGENEFIDDQDLDLPKLRQAIKDYSEATGSACPSPGEWMNEFLKADHVIAVTISSQLSGSYRSALIAKEMVLEQYPNKKIHVVDSLSAGTGLVLIVEKINELINKQLEFDQIVEIIEEYTSRTKVLFTFTSFENLVKNGRMSRFVGFLAGKLNMWVVGIGTEGKIDMLHKTRGKNKLMSFVVEEMERRGVMNGQVIIGHVENEETATQLGELIEQTWEDIKVKILPLRGLCGYYAEDNGMIIGFNVNQA